MKLNNLPIFNLNFYRKVSLFINKSYWSKQSDNKKLKKSNLDELERFFNTNGYCKIKYEDEGETSSFLNYLENNFELKIEKGLNNSQIKIVGFNELKNQHTIDFLKNKKLYSLISNYIGYKPRLFGASVIGSNPTSFNSGSQLFHLDNIEENSLRVILLLCDVGLDNGPTTIINKVKSKTIAKKINYFKRRDYANISDKEFNLDEKDKIYLTGAKGDIFILDTYSCFHSGGRIKQGNRLVFFATVGRGLFTNLRWMYNGNYDYGIKL